MGVVACYEVQYGPRRGWCLGVTGLTSAWHTLGVMGTFGRSQAVMWCFGMRHFAPWWMTMVCVGLASFGAISRVSGGTGPATGGTGSCSEPVGA